MNDKFYNLLIKLLNQTELEDSDGNFRVILDYDNYQDGARIIVNGKVINQCYDSDKSPNEQFISAIEKINI